MYIIQEPGEKANPTNRYRVTTYAAWAKAVDRTGPTPPPALSEHATANAARAARRDAVCSGR